MLVHVTAPVMINGVEGRQFDLFTALTWFQMCNRWSDDLVRVGLELQLTAGYTGIHIVLLFETLCE